MDLTPNLLKEVRDGWEIYSGSMGSDIVLQWLKSMSDNAAVTLPEELPITSMMDKGEIREFFKVNSIKELLSALAMSIDASFIITGEGKSKWVRIGPSDGIRLVFDGKRETLKLWKRPRAWSPRVSEPKPPALEKEAPVLQLKTATTERTLKHPILRLKSEGALVHTSNVLSPLSGSSTQPALVAEPEGEGSSNVHPDVPIDSLGRVRTQEDLEEEITFTQVPVITQRTVPRVSASRLSLTSPGIEDLITSCRVWEGPVYPPPGTNENFAGVICRLRVSPSPIAGRGTFLNDGIIEKNELIGFYDGILIATGGPFVMTVFPKSPNARNIDGCPTALGHESPFGMMNEDLHRGVPNVEVLPSGLFRAIRIIHAGEELVIQYATGYDWSFLKSLALSGLSQEISNCVPELWHWIPIWM